jgi:hypothetical protein
MAKRPAFDKATLMQIVMEHALDHHGDAEAPHWAHIVESWSDAELAEAIGDATSATEAIGNAARVARRVQDVGPNELPRILEMNPDETERAPGGADAPGPEPTELQQRLVKAVKDHAMQNYDKDGWDIVVEAFTDRELAAGIGKARTERGAIAAVRKLVRVIDERRRDVQSTAF